MSAGIQKTGKRGGKRSTSWSKGQSGNPRGRKPDCEIKKARDLIAAWGDGKGSETIINTLFDIGVNGMNESARVSALVHLSDKLFGKAPSSHEISGPEGEPIEVQDKTEGRLTTMSDKQLISLVTAMTEHMKEVEGEEDGPEADK